MAFATLIAVADVVAPISLLAIVYVAEVDVLAVTGAVMVMVLPTW